MTTYYFFKGKPCGCKDLFSWAQRIPAMAQTILQTASDMPEPKYDKIWPVAGHYLRLP
jgi:hypothetical protein